MTELGFTFIAALPEGFDERTFLCIAEDGAIVIAHPDHPPHVLDEESGAFVEIMLS
jgi:hypothetical protein